MSTSCTTPVFSFGTLPALTTASDASNDASAGPTRVVWNSIYPPLQSLGPGVEVSAPLLNPEASGFQGTPPLSRSTSRSSSASVTPPPHTPFPAIQNVPVCEVGDVEQQPSYCLPVINHPSNVILPQPETHHSDDIPPQSKIQHFSDPSTSPLYTQDVSTTYYVYGPNGEPYQVLITPVSAAQTSCQFTFTANSQTTFPQQNEHGHSYVDPSAYQFSSDFAQAHLSQSPSSYSDDYTGQTSVTHSSQTNFDSTVQQPVFLPVMNAETSSVHPDPSLTVADNNQSQYGAIWSEWMSDETASAQADVPPMFPSAYPVPAGYIHLPSGQLIPAPPTMSLPYVSPDPRARSSSAESDGNASSDAAPSTRKRGRESNEASSEEGNGFDQPRKKRRHTVPRDQRKRGYPCAICKNFVTPGRERHHEQTKAHRGNALGLWWCGICRKDYSRKDALIRHMTKDHGGYLVEQLIYIPDPTTPPPVSIAEDGVQNPSGHAAGNAVNNTAESTTGTLSEGITEQSVHGTPQDAPFSSQ